MRIFWPALLFACLTAVLGHADDLTLSSGATLKVDNRLPDTISAVYSSESLAAVFNIYEKNIKGLFDYSITLSLDERLLTVQVIVYDFEPEVNKVAPSRYLVRIEPADTLASALSSWYVAHIRDLPYDLRLALIQRDFVFAFRLEKSPDYYAIVAGSMDRNLRTQFLPLIVLKHPILGEIRVVPNGDISTGWGWPLNPPVDPLTGKESPTKYVFEFFGKTF